MTAVGLDTLGPGTLWLHLGPDTIGASGSRPDQEEFSAKAIEIGGASLEPCQHFNNMDPVGDFVSEPCNLLRVRALCQSHAIILQDQWLNGAP